METVAWRDGRNPLRVRKGIGTLGGGTATFEKGVVKRPRALIDWFHSVRRLTFDFEGLASPKVEDSILGRQRVEPLDVNVAVAAILFHGAGGGENFVNARAAGHAIPLVGDYNPWNFYHDLVIRIGTREHTEADALFARLVPLAGLPSAPVVRKIHLVKCFPVAYQMSDLDAKSSEVAIESLTVSFDELRL